MRQKRMEFVIPRQGKTCLKQQELQMVSIKDFPNYLIQDKSRPMTIVGSDVVSLYPNLTWESAGEQVKQAILVSDITWKGVNWKEGLRYLALVRGFKWSTNSKLKRILPVRRLSHGLAYLEKVPWVPTETEKNSRSSQSGHHRGGEEDGHGREHEACSGGVLQDPRVQLQGVLLQARGLGPH